MQFYKDRRFEANQERMRYILSSPYDNSLEDEVDFMIWDRNGPIINLDASARSASRVSLLFENVYFLICLFVCLFFFFQKVGGGAGSQSLPMRGSCILGKKRRYVS